MCLLCDPVRLTATERFSSEPVTFFETSSWLMITGLWLFALYQGYQRCNPKLFQI